MSSKELCITEIVCDNCGSEVRKSRITHKALLPRKIVDFCNEDCFIEYVDLLKKYIENFSMDDFVLKDFVPTFLREKELRMFTRKGFAGIKFKYAKISEQAEKVIGQAYGVDQLEILMLTVRECKGGYEILEAKVLDEDSPEAFFEILRNGIN